MAKLELLGDVISAEDAALIQSWEGENFPSISSTDVKNFLDQNKDAAEIDIIINSRGGDVVEGWLIYDLLKNSGKKVTTTVEGKCYSIATIVLLAGDNRRMLKNSEILIHNPFIPFVMGFDSQELKQLSDELKKEENKIIDLYASETSADRETIIDYMHNEIIMRASEAKEMGFVHEIVGETKEVKAMKAYAFYKPNFSNMTLKERLNKIGQEIMNLGKEEIKNLDLNTEGGETLSVPGDELVVGASASPDGTHVVEYQEKKYTVVVEEGEITSVEQVEDEPDMEEENRLLKEEIENLKAKLAEKEEASAKVEGLEKEVSDLKAAKAAYEKEVGEKLTEFENYIEDHRKIQSKGEPPAKKKKFDVNQEMSWAAKEKQRLLEAKNSNS